MDYIHTIHIRGFDGVIKNIKMIVPPIFVDTSSISEQFSFDQSQINDLMDFTIKEITSAFAAQWENLAIDNLKSSRQQYINSLIVVDEGFAKGAVVLVGWLPNAVENGLESYDMKPGFLDGPNAKQGKSGKYNTIPFGFGTPGALEENFSGGILPQGVYDVVKGKPQTVVLKGGGRASQGLKLEELPQRFQQPQAKSIKQTQSKSFKEYQHKNSIYEGIRKVKDSVTGQNSYQSFRRVSENSDPDSWIHPGIDAAHLAQKTLDQFDIPSETGRAIDKFLS